MYQDIAKMKLSSVKNRRSILCINVKMALKIIKKTMFMEGANIYINYNIYIINTYLFYDFVRKSDQ